MIAGYPTTFDREELDADMRAIMDTVHFISSNLLHLIKFTAEFTQDAQIALLGDEQRRRAFLNTTNDVNEGALGILCAIVLQRPPNMSLIT
jgi:hypothetical protein